ncbi:BZ3500_MvSof-1268-A1-R1_Chr8-1g09842 [Microbotryum saponariae]|uniref:BZ3500_MvSof-1268-A1-R1_Chr8-1g09842 protein n=1 Tax=Microbotryum saponariae TaxID=289078 RepID=A0A2X0KSF6_9BASI|nr:BZ3500_MvSof-1268-A1-R1_Chr8-1g09842 [Microbotryum saponariae]SDA08128.1 BZ3501_MvSof-1269-A2-R1_Chr8-1g09565 [Microbotryum saponariae]
MLTSVQSRRPCRPVHRLLLQTLATLLLLTSTLGGDVLAFTHSDALAPLGGRVLALSHDSHASVERHSLTIERDVKPESTRLQLRSHRRRFVRHKRALGKAWSGSSSFKNGKKLGIGGMQVSVVSDDELLSYPHSFDKAENNPLQVNGHSAWGQIYTISTGKSRALNLLTNSFCAGGGWLSNGTLISVGGNPIEHAASNATANGIAALRMFTPCDGGKCQVQEFPKTVRLTSKRWYPSTVRLHDGSVIIIGGCIRGGYNNAPDIDNPTIEFFPPKGNGKQIFFKFLQDALNSNLFPISFSLPKTGYIFVAANKINTIYDWVNNQEYRLPAFPNGVVANYPSSGASALLPLTIANGYATEILICGGSTQNLDSPWLLSAQSPTSTQCARLKISGTKAVGGWQVEQMPESRLMGDAILTPDGKVLLVNGAGTGVAGYGNVANMTGLSNAGNPRLRPTLYDPVAASGSRFSTNFPSSKTERLYHSSATLVPDGSIFIAGSNPNGKVETRTYGTRYNTEFLRPPYMSRSRPTFSGQPKKIQYKSKYTFSYKVPSGTKKIRAVIIDIGYSTHGVHMNQRWVELKVISTDDGKITIQGPQGPTYYPPGYAWLWILADDVPSKGKRVMIGKGQGGRFYVRDPAWSGNIS